MSDTTTKVKEYGLLLQRENRHGTDYVVARIVRRDGESPIGCSTDGEREWDGEVPKHLRGTHLDGLCMHGFVSDFGDCDYIGFEPEYRDVYAVDLRKAQAMAKTIKRVVAQQERDKAREPGDVLASFAKALKLGFVAKRRGPNKGSSYSDNEWNFMSIAEGRNEFRHLINEARTELRERLGKKVA